ncbi:helix-turn-helix domain-containing protein [Patescibacteria group bacterium]|nr:helix-turn-helix domain-containing protein [Patescibacteria group bacterium]
MSFIRHKIKNNTIGDVLKQVRKSFNLSLKQVESKTNISLNYLKFLENNNFYKFSSPSYARGALKKYSEFLKIDSKDMITNLNRDFKVGFNKNRETLSKTNKLKLSKQSFGIKSAFVTVFMLLVLLYLGINIKQGVLTSPEIKIFNPVDNLITQESTLIIKGRVSPISSNLFVNNESIVLNSNGFFKQEIELSPGLNNIEISATKQHAKKTVINRKIILKE